MPTEYKSLGELADSLILSEDDRGFQEMLASASDVAKIQTAESFREELIDRMFNGPQIVGPAMQIQKLEDKLRFPRKQTTVWFGPNGHGKSLVTSQAGLDMAFAEEPVLIASFEMHPVATLQRMVKQAAGTANPSRRFVEAFLRWAQGRIWIYNQRELTSSAKLLDLCMYASVKLGVRHHFIDSLMKCVKGEEDYDGQKDFVDRCCKLALGADAHVHLVHHVRKGVDETQVPGKYDAKGTGAISDQVDCMVGVWRNKAKEEKRRQGKLDDEGEKSPDAILNIDKNRHIEWEGKVGLYYCPGVQSYTELRGRPLIYPIPMDEGVPLWTSKD